MEATSTVAESYKIQHAAEHVAVVIEDSTVVSRSGIDIIVLFTFSFKEHLL